MALRLVFAAALVAILGSAAEVAPAMFSRQYVETLRGVDQLEDADVARLHRQLSANPDDLQARLKLMAYHLRGDRADRPADRAERVKHALWLIQHHPESEILHSPFARFSNSQINGADLRSAIALWEAAAKSRPADATIQWNAATFVEGLDAGLHLRYLEATAAADPNHPFTLRPLAHLYALLIVEGGPLAQRAQAGLDASLNVWVLGNAAYVFQSLYNQSLQTRAPNQRARELAERYYIRAKALDPNLERNAILPQLDIQDIARARQTEQQARRDWDARAAGAVGRIRRLPPDVFPDLPASIRDVLNARGCRVPQPSSQGPPRNVIRGEFIETGVVGWAVLCFIGNSTALLVFRNANDTQPQLLNSSEDRTYLTLDADEAGYSRQITAVGREYILRHYRAHGGPQPPTIDHEGVDDAFLEKASVTWYFHKGKWLKLQGAD